MIVLNDMRPAGAIYNATHVSALNANRVRNRLMGFASQCAFSNFSHQFVIQLGRVVPLAFLATMLAHVRVIFAWVAPSQIAKAIIAGVAVVMQALHAVRARADEGQENEPVKLNAASVPLACSQTNNLASVFVVGPRGKGSPFIGPSPLVVPTGPNRPVIANAVAIKSRNLFVSDHESILSQMDPEAIA